MISVKRNGNFKYVLEKIENINREFKAGSFLEEVAQLLNASIQIRVQTKGQGVNGKPLKAYSDSYGAWKSKKGRNISFRDLTYSGKMWQSLTTSGIPGGAKMFFNGAENANKAKGNQARTPFFGLGRKERAILKRELRKLTNVN